MDASLMQVSRAGDDELSTAPPALALEKVRRAAPWITLPEVGMNLEEVGGSSRADGIKVPKVEE
jgi:hypothetical protein